MSIFDEEVEEFELEFELLNSSDGKLITLVCSSPEMLSPDAYAQALRAFADRIDVLGLLSEADVNVVN